MTKHICTLAVAMAAATLPAMADGYPIEPVPFTGVKIRVPRHHYPAGFQ